MNERYNPQRMGPNALATTGMFCLVAFGTWPWVVAFYLDGDTQRAFLSLLVAGCSTVLAILIWTFAPRKRR